MVDLVLIILIQLINCIASYKLSGRVIHFLNLSQIILSLNLIGTIVLENTVYLGRANHLASIYLVAFSFFLNLGVVLHKIVYSPRVTSSTISSPLIQKGLVNNFYLILVSLLLFTLIAVIFFYINGIPLLANDLYFSRKAAQEGQNFFYRIFLYGLPIISGTALASFYVYKNVYFKVIAICSILITCICLSLLGFKGYVLWYIVFIMMIVNVYQQFNFKLFVIGTLLFLIGIASALLVTYFTYEKDIVSSLLTILARMTVIASSGFNILIYEYLPANIGQPIPSPIQEYLTKWKFGSDSQMAENDMSLTITVVGASILYFGKIGAVLFAILLGVLGEHLNKLTAKYYLTPLFTVFLTYLSFSIVGLVARGYFFNFIKLPLASLLIICLFYILFTMLVTKRATFKYSKLI